MEEKQKKLLSEAAKRWRGRDPSKPLTCSWCGAPRKKGHSRCVKHVRRARRLSRYGLSLQDYEEMLHHQGGKCAICKEFETKVPRKGAEVQCMSVDHCHRTGRVRGLLCHKCNTLLGKAQDSISLLREAAVYLERYA